MYVYVREHLRVLHVKSKNVFFLRLIYGLGCLGLVDACLPEAPKTSLALEI
jgi:hypothetical protein